MKFRDEFAFLSNFFSCNVAGFSSNEHFFQAMKTIVLEERELIRKASTPGKAKRLGRKVTLRADWNEIRLRVMEWGLRRKFSDPVLMGKLKNIEGEIVEDNDWHDTFWGVCNGEGRNELGKLLMSIRDEPS